jgi:NitT/TauT family transport system ATP-binding protein
MVIITGRETLMDIKMLHLFKAFDKVLVLKDVSLTFTEGQVNCLMGASGIGKTTVINLLMGLISQDSGEVRGMEDKRIAVVFQEDRLIEHWDSVDNVKLVCSKQITKEMVEEELSRVGLRDYENKQVSTLSGGMRRRVAIVRALLASSNLVIMDEPFKGLDENLKKKVLKYVCEKTKGKTVIIVTHDKEEIELLGANRIVME